MAGFSGAAYRRLLQPEHTHGRDSSEKAGRTAVTKVGSYWARPGHQRSRALGATRPSRTVAERAATQPAGAGGVSGRRGVQCKTGRSRAQRDEPAAPRATPGQRRAPLIW